jgi:putative transposase
MKFDFMKQHQGEFPVKKMAVVLNISSTGYYRYINKKTESKRQIENKSLIDKIKIIYQKNRGVYGSPRIQKTLQKNGELYSRKRIAKLMKINNIKAKTVKRYRGFATKSTPAFVAPNKLQQVFIAEKPNQVWTTDFTYVETKQGWLYVAAVLDLFSRKIVGLSMSNRANTDLVSKAFEQAMIHRKPQPGLVIHSDRGSQYTSNQYQMATYKKGVVLSMSAKGNCYDNAVTESFFKTLKTEHIYFYKYQTYEEARRSIFEYVEVFYNRSRIHSTLGYLSPVEYEKQEEIRESRVKSAMPAAEATRI